MSLWDYFTQASLTSIINSVSTARHVTDPLVHDKHFDISINFFVFRFQNRMNRLAVYSYLTLYVMGMSGVANQRTFARKELLKKNKNGYLIGA